MMNYLGYLRKRNPAGTPRRTLSHFLVCDSDKKKSVLANTFSDLFFAPPCRISSLARGNGKNCAASSRLFFFSAVRFSPCSRMGFLGLCRASGARSRGVPASPEPRRGGTISPRERSARTSFRRGSAVPIRADAFPRIRSRKKKSVPLRLARPWAGTLLSARDFSARARLRGRLFSCPT